MANSAWTYSFLSVLAYAALLAPAVAGASNSAPSTIKRSYGNIPLSFEINQG